MLLLLSMLILLAPLAAEPRLGPFGAAWAQDDDDDDDDDDGASGSGGGGGRDDDDDDGSARRTQPSGGGFPLLDLLRPREERTGS